jgi:hypothetical protein
MPVSQLDEKTVRKIHKKVLTGVSARKAAHDIGMTREGLTHHFYKYGLKVTGWCSNQTILTDQDIKKAVRMLNDGEGLAAIGRELNVHVKTLRRAFLIKDIRLKSSWIGRRPRKLNQAEITLATRLFKNGQTYDQVSKKTGATVACLRCHFTEVLPNRPAINFNPTKKDFETLYHLLTHDTDRKEIADVLDTTESFVKLMIVVLGIPNYFENVYSERNQHKMTAKDIRDFVWAKFQGVSTKTLIKKLGTSRPTMDKTLDTIELNYFLSEA